MPNPYFVNTIDLVNNTRARASDVESNFTAVEAGFDAVKTDVDTLTSDKANIASPTFTGDPKAPTPSAGDNDTSIATTAFVHTAVAAAAAINLPTVTGNDGRFLSVVGGLPSWEVISESDDVEIIGTNTNAVRFKTYVLTASLTLTMPASPAAGDWVRFKNKSDTTTAIIGRNGQNIEGKAEDMRINSKHIGHRLVFADATRGWVLA